MFDRYTYQELTIQTQEHSNNVRDTCLRYEGHVLMLFVIYTWWGTDRTAGNQAVPSSTDVVWDQEYSISTLFYPMAFGMGWVVAFLTLQFCKFLIIIPFIVHFVFLSFSFLDRSIYKSQSFIVDATSPKTIWWHNFFSYEFE